MKITISIVVIAVLAAIAGSQVYQCDVRSVHPIDDPNRTYPGRFDPDQSAALFVGVRRFTHDRTLQDVLYAVDDAVDLAHALAFDPRISLVRPARVVLALSGLPRKEESKIRLQELKHAGAVVRPAGLADVLLLLQEQTAKVGKDGIFIGAFASHGFNHDGVPYVLTSTSLFRHSETALSAAKVFDLANDAGRSLIFIDACREKVRKDERTGEPEPLSMAPLIEGMSNVAGQVVFYAAAAGKYAYDDPARQNGVFTATVLEGLRCRAGWDQRGLVTADTLSTYVETEVRSWVRRNRDRFVGSATQVSMDGQTKLMPLAVCSENAPLSFHLPDAPPPPLATAVAGGSSIEAFGEDGVSLWKREMNTAVAYAEVTDLDGDGSKEVLAAAGTQVVAFDPKGTRLWSSDTGRRVRKLVIGDEFRKAARQIVALSVAPDNSASSLSVLGTSGELLSTYTHAGQLRDLHVVKQTGRHAPKIIASAAAHIFMLDPKKAANGKEVWYGALGPAAQSIRRLEIADRDQDGRREIVAHTARGDTLHMDFDGRVLSRKGRVEFTLIPRR